MVCDMELIEMLTVVIFLHAGMVLCEAVMLKGVRDSLCNLDYDLLQMNTWLQLKCAKREIVTE